jgi:hypothetical protein
MSAIDKPFQNCIYLQHRCKIPCLKKLQISDISATPTDIYDIPPVKIADIRYIYRCTKGCDHLNGSAVLIFL